MSTVISFRPIDDLESSLITSWHEVTQATHQFLALLREFDLRQGWKSYGNVDCADWLNWRCGISRVTAQEKVRVARALWLLPEVDAAFADGRLSYSKVRALTRVATQRNEAELVAFALRSSAAHVEAYCRRLRNGDADSSAIDARRLHESRSLARSFREDGSGTITVELPKAELELVLQALEYVGRSLPGDPSRSLFAKGADALLQMARDALAGSADSGAAPDSYQVLVHVDATALSNRGGESDVPLSTARRLCCDGSIVPIVDDSDGRTLNVGRKQRVVPTAIKRALVARDRGCTFPGCHHTRWLDAHHVHHWADGGETSLENLLTLCSTHHRLVHEGGFSAQQNRDGSLYSVRPDGRPVEPPSSSAEDRVEENQPVYRVTPSSAEDGVGSCRGSRICPDTSISAGGTKTRYLPVNERVEFGTAAFDCLRRPPRPSAGTAAPDASCRCRSDRPAPSCAAPRAASASCWGRGSAGTPCADDAASGL
jgi:hypothetical protein